MSDLRRTGKSHVKYLAACLILATASLASAQEIITASQYFDQVAERYSQVEDYQAKISIATGKDVMSGAIAFKSPSNLRIDFSDPPDQVIAFDGQTLTVYIPAYKAVLSQAAAGKAGAGSASLASREGLKMMKRSYGVAFEKDPTPVPLEDAGSEKAVVLVLTRSTVAEGFKTIKIYVNPESKLIRRMEGWTLSGEKLRFDFRDITVNTGIPASRFLYDSPASANVYNNFLFKTEE
jgi:outer membrane lipoprotein carrier protein